MPSSRINLELGNRLELHVPVHSDPNVSYRWVLCHLNT
jgi:hypothetical protein